MDHICNSDNLSHTSNISNSDFTSKPGQTRSVRR